MHVRECSGDDSCTCGYAPDSGDILTQLYYNYNYKFSPERAEPA